MIFYCFLFEVGDCILESRKEKGISRGLDLLGRNGILFVVKFGVIDE